MPESLTEISTPDLQKKRDTLRRLVGFVIGLSMTAFAVVAYLVATQPLSARTLIVVTPLLVILAALPQSYARVRAMDQELARRGVDASR